MKVSKKILLYIGITAYVFVAGIMGFILFRQMDEQDAVSKQVSETQTSITMLRPNIIADKKAGLENDLTELTGQTDVLKTALSPAIGNVDVSEDVFRIAATENVEVLELSSPAPSVDYLEGVPCDVVLINATVQGDLLDLVDFVTRLNSDMSTGIVQTVDMEILTGDNVTASTATIFMEVFNYKGD